MSRSEVQIQGTSDSCTVSKCSLSQCGYIQDSYILHFVNKTSRRAPLINLGYFVRTRVISNAVESYLAFIGERLAQVISCGAGFDSNYFVLSGLNKLSPNLIYVEIDYPDVVMRKRTCINNSNLKELVGDVVSPHNHLGIKGINYKLIGCDLEKESELSRVLADYEIDFTLPTLFFSECAITYMKVEGSSQLIKWAAEHFDDAAFVTYEQIHPFDGFGMIMVSHFQKLHSPLQSIAKYPTLTSQEERYIELGWSSCTAKSVLDIYLQTVTKEEQIKVLSLEPFDELEELHSKCCHYSLSVATKGALVEWEPLSQIKEWIPSKYCASKCNWTLTKTVLRRFHHASCQIGRDQFLVIGGFGPRENGANARISGVSIVTLNNARGESSASHLPVEAPPKIKLDRVHHYCEMLNEGQVIIFGGRTSPLDPLSDCLLLTLNKGDSNEVKAVKVEQMESCSQLRPPPRWRFSAVIVGKEDNKFLMVFGGRGNCSQTLGDLWSFSLKSYTWQKEEHTSEPGPRFAHSAAIWERSAQVLVSGGLTDRGCGYPLNEIWGWNYISKKWNRIEVSVEWPNTMLPRYGHSSAVVIDHNGEDLLIMTGGVNGLSGYQPGIGVLNLQKLTPMEFTLPTPSPEFPLMTFNHSCHISADKSEIIILGGGGTCFSFGTSFNNHIIKIKIKQFFN